MRSAYHLLRNHNCEAGQSRAPDTWNREQLRETSDVVALANNGSFDLELAVDVVDIAGGLKLMVSKTGERLERLRVAVLLHEPSRLGVTSATVFGHNRVVHHA